VLGGGSRSFTNGPDIAQRALRLTLWTSGAERVLTRGTPPAYRSRSVARDQESSGGSPAIGSMISPPAAHTPGAVARQNGMSERAPPVVGVARSSRKIAAASERPPPSPRRRGAFVDHDRTSCADGDAKGAGDEVRRIRGERRTEYATGHFDVRRPESVRRQSRDGAVAETVSERDRGRRRKSPAPGATTSLGRSGEAHQTAAVATAAQSGF